MILRLKLIAVMELFLITIIAFRLIQLQVFQSYSFSSAGFREHFRKMEIPSRRGAISDCKGRILSVSLACDSLYADPKLIADPEKLSVDLATVLGKSSDELLPLLSNSQRRFCWLQRKISPLESERIRELNYAGLFFRKESIRFSPPQELCAAVTGITGIDGRGLEGLEEFFNSTLQGRNGFQLVAQDALSRPFRSKEFIIKEPENGQELQLTLDQAVQHFAMRELKNIVESENARWGGAVVIDTRTMSLLAMATYPSFDPNHYQGTLAIDRKNRCITELIEPGSTFKAVTVAAALDTGAVQPEDVFFCQNGSIRIGSAVFEDWKPFGNLTVTDVLANSSNVGTIKIAQKATAKEVREIALKLGFARKILPFPGCQSGSIHPETLTKPATGASLSIGYGISATPLQLAYAYAVFAANGTISPLRFLLKDEQHTPVRVMGETACRQLRNMLRKVVDSGTGKSAKPSHFSAAGKTGTARRFNTDLGRYEQDRIVCSFAGFAPAESPRIAICVVIDDPRKNHWASHISAPVFAKIAEQVLVYFGEKPEKGANA